MGAQSKNALRCLLNIFDFRRFGNERIHTSLNGSVSVFLLDVTWDAYDCGLFCVDFVNILTNLLSRLITVHLWHITIHQYQFIWKSIFVSLFESFYRFQTVTSSVNSISEIEIWNVGSCTLKNDLEGIQVERLIINNHNSFNFNLVRFSDRVFVKINFMFYFLGVLSLVYVWQMVKNVCW